MSKQNQSKFAIVSIIMVIVAFVIFIAASFFESLSNYTTYLMVAGMVVLAAAWAIYFFGGRSTSQPESAQDNVISVMACRGCDMREERAFVKGDYILKEVGPCKKCAGTSYIKAIYAVTPKKDTK